MVLDIFLLTNLIKTLWKNIFCQRSRDGANENPDLRQYGYNELKLQITKSNLIRAMGNTKGRKHDDTNFRIDNSSLPKKCKKEGKK